MCVTHVFIRVRRRCAFFDIVGLALTRGIGLFFLVFMIAPALVIGLGYIIYIVVMTIKELKK